MAEKGDQGKRSQTPQRKLKHKVSPSLSEGRPLKLKEMTQQEFQERHKDNPVLSKIEDLKASDIMRVLNGAYLSERFFNRSKSWFSQKLNNNIKNGKPCEFTPEEITTLRNALYTISIELQEIADDLQ